MVEVGM